MERPSGLNRFDWWWCRWIQRHPMLRAYWTGDLFMLGVAGIAVYSVFRSADEADSVWMALLAGGMVGSIIGRNVPVSVDKIAAALTAELLEGKEAGAAGEPPTQA